MEPAESHCPPLLEIASSGRFSVQKSTFKGCINKTGVPMNDFERIIKPVFIVSKSNEVKPARASLGVFLNTPERAGAQTSVSNVLQQQQVLSRDPILYCASMVSKSRHPVLASVFLLL